MALSLAEIIGVLVVMTGLYIGLAKWIVNKTMDGYDKRIKSLEDEQKELKEEHHENELALAKLETKIEEDLSDIKGQLSDVKIEIKTNYTKRFDGINEKLNAHHEESILALEKIKSSVERQHDICVMIQKQKEN